MKEEIKEILDKLYLDFEKANITAPEYSDLRDYITNLENRIDKALDYLEIFVEVDTLLKGDMVQPAINILKGDKDE